jgi:hypothetical protein
MVTAKLCRNRVAAAGNANETMVGPVKRRLVLIAGQLRGAMRRGTLTGSRGRHGDMLPPRRNNCQASPDKVENQSGLTNYWSGYLFLAYSWVNHLTLINLCAEYIGRTLDRSSCTA